MNERLPAISVIIPMYNAEKYIEQCLDSVLTQTFTDYEVIVADDCSTDRSVELVTKIISDRLTQGGGRKNIRLTKLLENSGGAALPRNHALKLSRGKYVFFLDGDDIITTDALQKLHTAAEHTNADVVHVEKYFETVGNIDAGNRQARLRLNTHQSPPFVDKLTVETDDLNERVQRFCQRGYMWWACSKLFRRDFLIDNEIAFISIPSTEDMIFSFCTVCCAKTYVRIPAVIYVYRQTPDSLTRVIKPSAEQQLKRYIKIISEGTRELDRFMSGLDFFNEHPDCRYDVLNFFIETNIGFESWIYSSFPLTQLDDILRRDFLQKLGDNPILTAQLFNLANIYSLELEQLGKQLVDTQIRMRKGGELRDRQQ